MSMVRFLVAALFTILATNAFADEIEFTWVGVDVVSKDFDSIEAVRAAVGIHPGQRLAMSSTVLAQACLKARKFATPKKVRCNAIEMENHTALYVVQISDQAFGSESAAKRDCPVSSSGDTARVVELSNQILLEEKDQLSNSVQPLKASLTANGSITDNAPGSHTYDKVRNAKAIVLKATIYAGVNSCNSEIRAAALHLMSYLDQPEKALALGIEYSVDADENVRNRARLLTLDFLPYATKDQLFKIADVSCAALLSSDSFFDRNKSLLNIKTLIGKSRSVTLSKECRTFIGRVARSSTSEQIGIPAQQILALVQEHQSR